MTEPSIAVGPPTATPRPWTVDIIEGGGWAVVVDADDEQAKVIAELDDTYGDRAANASLIVEAVNAYGADNALNAKVRQRITQAFDGEYSESEALRAFAEDGWPVDWPDVRQAQAEYEAAHPLAVEPDGLPLDVRSDVQHALEAINAALDKASYGDSVESDLFEAHATLDTLLGGTPSEAKP